MILLMGIAGSGKGTQGKMLADTRGFHLVSMGDVIRMYVTGKQRERMLQGDLLDDQEIITIVDKVLALLPEGEEVVLDGFPRTITQAQWLIDQAKAGRFKVDKAFHLVVPREVVKDRLVNRGRIDDTENAIEARFDQYDKSTMPLLSWLSEHGVKVVNVNAKRSVREVNKDLVNYLEAD
ncbi:MAG TPA: nucleoside monophosphate kinase [Candidatus Saccharimonadales bacterium]|nr:nucleoside monophosphate kinase [Candidatus Saccharimonadales bacterium]